MHARNRNGQALVELIVGLIVILALTAGMLQVASLTRASANVMEAARSHAGERAFSETYFSPFPDYIAEVLPGPDGRAYTRDDETTAADSGAFIATIVNRSAGSADGWAVLDEIPANPVNRLREAPVPVFEFGLIGAIELETIPLLPAVRNLIYAADEIEVEGRAWSTWTRGIY